MQSKPSGFVELSRLSKSSKLNRYSEEEQSCHCEEWKKSGLSMNKYCKRAGISVSSLSTWVNQPKKQSTSTSKVDIENCEANTASLMVEIILMSGLRLRCSKTSMAKLLELIKALESCN